MRRGDRKALNRFLGSFDRTTRILDVGCGVGDNIKYMKTLGFENICGVDISEKMVLETKKHHEIAYTVDLFKDLKLKFDLILFSHIIEHIPYDKLKSTIESYLEHLIIPGDIIILTPSLYDAFYNDVDHIKPYYPQGLITLFSSNKRSRQYESSYELDLIDLQLRRESLSPYLIRSRFFSDVKSRIIRKAVDSFYEILKICSAGAFSKVTGYGAHFKVRRQQEC